MPRTLGRVVACSGGRGEIIAAAHNALPRVQPVNCGAHLEEHQPALRLAGAHQPALRTDGEPLASGVPARGQRERLRCPAFAGGSQWPASALPSLCKVLATPGTAVYIVQVS